MFARLLEVGLMIATVYCEEFSVEVRLFSSWTHSDSRKTCDLLIMRSIPLWNKGGFRKCLAGVPIEIDDGGFITPYVITVNTKNIKHFARNTRNNRTLAFINRKLNLNTRSCATVTGPNWQKILGSLPTSYPLEINVYTTAADQEDVTCTTVINNIRKASPLLRPIDCLHETTPSKTAQMFHHRFEVNMPMPETKDRPVTETVVLQLLWIQRILKLERSSCAPISVPKYDSKSKLWNFPILLNEYRQSTINCSTVRDVTNCWPRFCKVIMIPGYTGPLILHVQFDASICGHLVGPAKNRGIILLVNSFLNGMNTRCPVIQYAKTKNAFDKVQHEGYYYAIVSGPSHVDVCRKAKKYPKYGVQICEEVQHGNGTSADKRRRTFRMRLEQPINFNDIPWYLNEHSKFVHFLNSRSSKCKFNGYVQLNESDDW